MQNSEILYSNRSSKYIQLILEVIFLYNVKQCDSHAKSVFSFVYDDIN